MKEFQQDEQIILGVDPGTTIMGYGLIKVVKKKMILLNFGVIRLEKYETQSEKLRIIFNRMSGLIDEYQPNVMALEAPFFGKNVQSMLKLGRAQGVAIAAAVHKNLDFCEYAPKKIKQSITGNGNAAKEQVAAMLQSLFKIQEMPKHLDATDGLAAAVCHYFQGGQTSEGKSYSSWQSFVKKNPGRKLD